MVEPRPLRLLLNLRRTGEIASVMINQGFADLVEQTNLRAYLRWGRSVITRKDIPVDEPITRARRIRNVMESLGPTFIKFGQIASTRPDLLPVEVIKELTLLQEAVSPFDGMQAKQVVEQSLGKPVTELFLNFDVTPFAAGSLAQVHRAIHHDGTLLAVKIRRPNVVRDIERDLILMQDIAGLMARNIPETELFDPEGLVNHFGRSVRRELNLLREMRTMQEFKRMFSQDASLYVPNVYPEYCAETVLTMEFIQGIRPDELEQYPYLVNHRQQIAINGARIFLKQAFEHGVFHGDPHPGNVRIKDDGSICLLDYGMFGSLDDNTRDLLIDLLLAISTQNVHEIIRVILALGESPQHVDQGLLEIDIRDFLSAYYNVPLTQLDVGHLLSDFMGILMTHRIRCPGDIMLLIRALVHLESCGRHLDPEFNFAEVLYPFVTKLLQKRYHPARVLQRALHDLNQLAKITRDIPVQTQKLLQQFNQGKVKLELEHKNLDRLVTELDRSGNRLVIGMIVSSLIVSSSLVIRSGSTQSWFTVSIFVISSLLGIWLIYGIFRSGQL